jgi:hypothetical protein
MYLTAESTPRRAFVYLIFGALHMMPLLSRRPRRAFADSAEGGPWFAAFVLLMI